MCDPIIDKSIFIETDQFKEENVKEYIENKRLFTKHPSRHYSQLETNFQAKEIEKLLQKLDIPFDDTRVTIFGGYTGQFASCLRDIGMKVIFTDPLEEWVRQAPSEGFEAYQFTAEQIPKKLLTILWNQLKPKIHRLNLMKKLDRSFRKLTKNGRKMKITN